MGGWKAFPTAKDMDKITNVFASMSSGLNFFYRFTRTWIYFTLPQQLSRGAYRRLMIPFSTTFFPEQGVCFALRNYDILLSNPQKIHCVSFRKDPSNDKANDFYCVSLYLKTAVVGGNDNSLELTVEQEKIVNTMLNIN
jgi:hypothetical protein